jgi:hypothetical protein
MRKLLKKCKYNKYILVLIFSIKFSCACAQLNLIKDPSFEDTLPNFQSANNHNLKFWNNLDSIVS